MTLVVRPASRADEERAAAILAEYHAALEIVVRDTAADLRGYLEPPGGMWLAEADGSVIGCIALRPLAHAIGEMKRLYVRPEWGARGIADALLDALEGGAIQRGFREVYLDTHDGLQAATRFYQRRGYTLRERYNDNPQATLFMQRKLR